MLIAFAGYVSGYNGSFEFKEPGVAYEDYPYYGMRLVSVHEIYVFDFQYE